MTPYKYSFSVDIKTSSPLTYISCPSATVYSTVSPFEVHLEKIDETNGLEKDLIVLYQTLDMDTPVVLK